MPSVSKYSTPASFSLVKRRVPEMQVQDFALAGQEIVFDVEAVHGFEMAAQDGGRNQLRDLGGFVAAFFDGVQRLGADLQVLLVFSYHCETRA